MREYPHQKLEKHLPKQFNSNKVDWSETIGHALFFGFVLAVIGVCFVWLPIKSAEDQTYDEQHRPKLPAHVMAGPNNSFLVARGHEKLGVVLCKGGDYTEHKLPNETIISCGGNANEFVYSKARVWHP